MKTIDLVRLKRVVTRLLDEAIREHGSAHFDLEENSYWAIPFPKEFDLSATPVPDHVGSLHDDWDLTCWLCDEPEIVSAYALTEVAPLLNYVGNRIAARLG